ADQLYPLEVFPRAFALLEAAKAAAQDDPDPQYAARIAFHHEGLVHAQLCVETAAVMNAPTATAEERSTAIARLAAYRRSIESTNIANLDRASRIETESWQDLPGFAPAP